MKRYTRKGLIRYFEKLPPKSRPCQTDVCPIATFMGPKFVANYPEPADASVAAMRFDPLLASAIDASDDRDDWTTLTASKIVKIAKAAPHV